MTERHKEGAVYKTFTVEGVTFEIKYGYESPQEKERGWEPTPIYPDFATKPQYTERGYPFVTVYQGVCEHYKARKDASEEGWCADCEWMERCEQYVGVCRCKKRKRKNDGGRSDES